MRAKANAQESNTQKQQSITGVVEHIFFSNHKFSAGKLRDDNNKQIKFAGPVVISKDERIIIHGSWKEHKIYGKQFQVDKFAYDRPHDKKGL